MLSSPVSEEVVVFVVVVVVDGPKSFFVIVVVSSSSFSTCDVVVRVEGKNRDDDDDDEVDDDDDEVVVLVPPLPSLSLVLPTSRSFKSFNCDFKLAASSGCFASHDSLFSLCSHTHTKLKIMKKLEKKNR